MTAERIAELRRLEAATVNSTWDNKHKPQTVARYVEAMRVALPQALDEIVRLRAALKPLIVEPAQIFDGDKPLDEWVCCHCGTYGTTATNIAHDAGCEYVVGRALLDGGA